jgi:cobalt-zinc-cadmium resistance protein CzcA
VGQVGLAVPLFYGAYKRQSSVLDLELKQNSLNKKYASETLNAGFQQTMNAYSSLLDSYTLYAEQLIPQTVVMREQGLIMLETGEISMIEFLQTKQSIIDIELNYIKLIKDINQTIHQLNWYQNN